MRIAYITPYQGPTLVRRRPVIRNRSLSNRTKIEEIARLLRSKSHEVEIFSHGEVVENRLRLYPAFEEPERFDSRIPVYYVSALPIRYVNGLWASLQMMRLLARRNGASPFDLLIIFNLKRPQLACARYAVRRGIPVILEYEDDAFRTVTGESPTGWVRKYHERAYRDALAAVSGCMAVSPHLLSQAGPAIPKLLLRGVVGDDILQARECPETVKRDIVLFSGTHTRSNGIAELIAAWRTLATLSGWELHITGQGELTDQLRRMAQESAGVVFHGLVDRDRLVSLMTTARICINPHAVSRTPGNVFAFKLIEYIAAGAHVITTPMGVLEPELEAAVTYMRNNHPETIAATLRQVIDERRYENTAARAADARYGLAAVGDAISTFVDAVQRGGGKRIRPEPGPRFPVRYRGGSATQREDG